MNFQKRISSLQKLLIENKLDSIFISNRFNIFYLTGFKGVSETEREVTAWISSNCLKVFVPKLYQEEALALSKKNEFEVLVIEERDNLFKLPIKINSRDDRVGFEANDLKYSELQEFKKILKTKPVPTYKIVEGLRMIKDKEELNLVKQAVKVTDKAFTQIKNEIRIGITEKQIARRLVDIMETLDADGPSFEPIVAYGVNSSLPHYVSQNIAINEGILLIDAGASYRSYNADLTRTFFLGDPSEKFVKMYNLVLTAQATALRSVKSGIKEKDPYLISHKAFGKEAKHFIHGLGHGIGLEIHEEPYLRKGRINLLKKGMHVTLEPGLYYPGWGGIRIEDYVVVTDDGCTVLSKTPKELKDIIIC